PLRLAPAPQTLGGRAGGRSAGPKARLVVRRPTCPQAAGEISKRTGLAPENEGRHPCRLDLMRDIWAHYEALLLSKLLTRVRSHPQRSAQTDADLRGVVTVEREGLPHP